MFSFAQQLESSDNMANNQNKRQFSMAQQGQVLSSTDQAALVLQEPPQHENHHMHKPAHHGRNARRKTMTHSKPAAEERKNQNTETNSKQIKLTEYWKGSNTALSESKSKDNLTSNGLKKKMMDEEKEIKNKIIEKLKNDRDVLNQKYSQLANDKESYEKKAMEIIKTTLLQVAQNKRRDRCEIISRYGYYKDNVFVEGSFLKQIRAEIELKNTQIQEIKSELASCKKDKETLKFKERFFQKQLDELNKNLKDREKTIQTYKERLRFADKENNCFYAKLKWPLVSDRYQTLELLGSGGFGEVYKCFDLRENRYVALKENRFSSSGVRAEEQRVEFLKHVKREVNIQRKLSHPNIIKIMDVININQSEVSFVMEHCSGPELSTYYKRYGCLEQKEAKEIIRQIFCGLKYLYEQDNKIIHYDLKPTNIMFHNGVVKILDFGLCKQMDSEDTRIDLTSQGVGTYWYLPPETFREYDSEVSSKVDVWSTGVIFYELLYGKRPFGHGISQAKIYNEGIILKAIKVDFPDQTPLRYKVSTEAKQFIKSCLKYNQEDRLSPIDAYNHQYFK